MWRDHGLDQPAWLELVARVRLRLAELVDTRDPLVAVPLCGDGRAAMESAIGTFLPHDGHLLAAVNGPAGHDAYAITRRMGRRVHAVAAPAGLPLDPGTIDAALHADPSFTHVTVTHCEVETGVLNPLAAIAAVAERRGVRLIVDAAATIGAMSFGGPRCQAVVGTACACLEGPPGLAFVLADAESLAGATGRAHALALDLHEAWMDLEGGEPPRAVLPTHVMAAVDAALEAHAARGGVAGRERRYRENLDRLVRGLGRLGFRPRVQAYAQSPVAVCFDPPDASWDLHALSASLLDRGFLVPRAASDAVLRVGVIGHVQPHDIDRFVAAVRAWAPAAGARERASDATAPVP